MRLLLRRHYRDLRVPPILDDHLLRLLRQNPLFVTWPLNEIVTDRDAFFAFLQERWPIFLDRQTIGETSIHEQVPQTATTALRYSGPTQIPFGHGDVRVYVDNLFMEGMLQPVKHPRAERWRGSWEITGVRTDPEADLKRRIDALLASVEESIPDRTARHQDWLGFAQRWAQVNALLFGRDGAGRDDARSRHRSVRDRVDTAFTAWLFQRFGTLHNQPPSPPVMTHHVPRVLARTLEDFHVRESCTDRC